MKSVKFLSLFALLLLTSPVAATPIASNESRLAVYTHGFKVGEINSRYSLRDGGGHEVLLYSSHTRIKGVGESMTVRLLDLESGEVVTRWYRWLRSERLTQDGKSPNGSYSVRAVDPARWPPLLESPL